jgi:hypothetical protein
LISHEFLFPYGHKSFKKGNGVEKKVQSAGREQYAAHPDPPVDNHLDDIKMITCSGAEKPHSPTKKGKNYAGQSKRNYDKYNHVRYFHLRSPQNKFLKKPLRSRP